MALFDIGLAKQVDLMCIGIREKLETESCKCDDVYGWSGVNDRREFHCSPVGHFTVYQAYEDI
jgi:hypothetical protein